MTNCICGAPMAKHPKSGYSECGACIEALKAHTVKVACDWPTCGKRVRKFNLGSNFCKEHRKLEWDAFMGIMNLEGPSSLNRPTPTVEERYEFWQNGGRLPASRLVPVTFETTKLGCMTCGGPMIMVNDPDWSPDLPNSVSCRYTTPGNAGSAVAWGIGICRTCTLGLKATA